MVQGGEEGDVEGAEDVEEEAEGEGLVGFEEVEGCAGGEVAAG